MIDEKVHMRIMQALRDVQDTENVRILYACESGSRGWGFESEDSDYDVRFIYVHRPGHYLRIQRQRDVIERPIDDILDVSGWDIIKALELFRRSNPPLLEWLQSPVVYLDEGILTQRLRELMKDYYSPVSCMYHYLHMAQNNFKEFLKKDQVKYKKYFYVLRPVLACKWIQAELGVVPIEFEKLLNELIPDGPLRQAIDKLLVMKRAGSEIDRGPQIPEISDFLSTELERFETEGIRPSETRELAKLDELLRDVLIEQFGNRII